VYQTCPGCSRRNPAAAAFCYYDGLHLPGRAAAAAAGQPGQRFSRPFVFASGRACHSFDELALACHDHWEQARAVLRLGTLEQFFATVGRLDLAQAAHAAARFPDPDRGLDQLLGQLPTGALSLPVLRVEPAEINLGALCPGQSCAFDLHLHNQGKRLLFGSVRCLDGDWLALGGPTGGPDKIFDCIGTVVMPVHVRGNALRARDKPLEVRLEVLSNGGTATVTVRAVVPVRPFSQGHLAGARTPRELAEKIRAAPRESAIFIENGAVAAWYRDNGWTFPIRTALASGVGAVQQFFEALGLARPPRVEVSPPALSLRGSVGAALRQALRVQAQERRPVWAHGVSNQPWLRVGTAQLDGPNALLPLTVAVPDQPGATLQAHVQVTANGNQRLVVGVTLLVEPRMAAPPPAAIPVKVEPVVPAVFASPEKPPARRRHWLWAAPALLLVLVLLGIALHDFLLPSGGPDDDRLGPFMGELDVQFHEGKVGDRLEAQLPGPTMRFGLLMLGPDGQPSGQRRLTADPWGRTNNTCLRIDGSERLFGQAPGSWVAQADRGWRDGGVRSVWGWDDKKVRASQLVELLRGEESNRRDTCLVRYLIENTDKVPHTIGIRFLLDTFIGSNDGVPFTIPGEPNLCADSRDFGKQVPAFIQALEREDLAHPGTVAHLKLKLGDREPPARVTLGAWPDDALQLLLGLPQARGVNTLWDVPVKPMKTLYPYDSAVVLYWDDKPLPPGGQREVAFAYGLGSVASSGGKVLLTVDGSFKPGGELTVTALVGDPAPGETVTLTVPAGFTVGGPATQSVPQASGEAGGRNRPVTWKVLAGPLGSYTLEVRTSTGATQSKALRIKETSIFD
jgi:hypothetical protein